MSNIAYSTIRAANALRRFLPKYFYALMATPLLFTIGPFAQRHRFLIFQIAKHFGMKMSEEEMKIPQVPLKTVLGEKVDLTLLEPLGAEGNVTLLELLVISTLLRRTQPDSAFEIGTFDGRTTLNLAANLGSNGTVYTLDLPRSGLGETKFALAKDESAFVDKKASGERFQGTEFATRIVQLYGDSAIFDFSKYHGQLGFVFVDGSHAFEYVLHDTETALKLTQNQGAIILWHDYQQDWPDVIRALNQLYQSNPALSGLRRIEGTTLVMLERENTGRPA